MVPNFVTKMISLNGLRSQDFEWTDQHNNAFQCIKQKFCWKSDVQPFSLDKDVTVTVNASEQAVGGFSHKNNIQWSRF